MSLYKQMIIYELNNNITFIKISIKNNNIECSNDIIKKDILNKIKNMDIKIIIFYTSLYDYEINKADTYWSTIKNLEKDQLPIYRKNDDIGDWIEWFSINFNNDKIDIYETSKFTKRKYIFDNTEECLKTVIYEQTNPKYKNFIQLFYHAGDNDDIERYGLIYIRTLFKNIYNINLDNNVFKNKNIEIWDKFNTSLSSITNTLHYLMEKMKKGILIAIKNNKLVVFLPFAKHNYKNDFYEELYFDDNDKKLLKEYSITKDKNILIKLENNVKYYYNKNHLNTKDVEFDRTKWIANDCFFNDKNYEGDQNQAIFEDFFTELCKNRELPDSVFFINLRDHPILHKELKNSYTSIVNKPLDDKYIHKEYCPILSVGGCIDNADIPMITQDDWKRIGKKIYPDDCKNGYIDEPYIIEWDNKYNKAVFRGSATGCAIGNDNIRIKASKISLEYPDLLDAGVISFNRKMKKSIGKPLQLIIPDIKKSNFMTISEKSKYKYILNLDGHVSAFRLGHEFSLKSVILIPDSQYYLWFFFILKPYEHYIPIKEDLSDLIEKIQWCKDNDSKCKQIAINSYEFYKKYLDRDGVFDYMQYVLSKISPKELSIPKNNIKIAIITLYRNQPDNTRLIQKRYFQYWMNKLLMNVCDFDIIIVEQYKGNPVCPFNIGKLKNIGFDYLNKTGNKYDNYIFVDIDSVPDSNLLKYFFKITDGMNSLSTAGTRYEQLDKNKPFLGAMISCTKNIFEKINGYPNNFEGWGYEDDNVILRCYAEKLSIYYNKEGKIIDTEEINGRMKNNLEKQAELKQHNEKEKIGFEKNYKYQNYKKNGLSNLNYELLNEFSYKNNFHIIVDLKMEESKKLYQNDYVFKEEVQKEKYNKEIKSLMYKIKQIQF
jgi:hypothetical protein